MLNYLRVDPETHVAVEAWTAPEDMTPADCFVAELAETFVPAEGDAAPGWTYADGKWAPPNPTPASSVPLMLAPRDFIALFTTDEQKAVYTAAQNNWQIAMFISLVTAGPVDLTNSEVEADINILVSNGLITQDRGEAILAGQKPGA